MSDSKEPTGTATDRRRPIPASPRDYVKALPAELLLDRLPIPIAALHLDGTVIYANTSFVEMLGHPAADIVGEQASRIFDDSGTASGEAFVQLIRDRAGHVIDLLHADGSTIKAWVSQSALVREDDPVVLVAFHDVTEQLWALGHVPDHESP